MSKIVAIKRDETEAIAAYKLDDGRVLSRDEAVAAADKGELEGVSSFMTRNGDIAIRSDRGQPNYALQDLPEFTE